MFLAKVENILLFLIILFLPTQLGLHFWPQFSYIYSLKVDYLSPTIYFWDLLVVGLLIAWVLRKPYINKIALNLFLFFLFTQALSLLGASNIGAGLVRLEQYTITGFFGIFFASHPFEDLIKKIRLPFTLVIIGEAIIASAEFIQGSTVGLWILGERSFSISTPGIAKFDFYGHEFLRPYATFPHPNVLAGFMLTILILVSFWEAKRPQNLKIKDSGQARMTCLVATFLASITIFLTMSRTVILAGFVSAAFLIRRKWLVLMGVLILVLSPILFTRFVSILNFDSLTLLRREELIDSAWQIFLKSPLYGIGVNNFIPVMANQLVAGPSRFLQPVHNIFLLVLSETGLIGLMGLVSLVGISIVSSLRRQGSNKRSKIFNLIPAYAGMTERKGILLLWLVIIFLGMFDHYFLTLPQGYRLLFLVWGLSLSITKTES